MAAAEARAPKFVRLQELARAPMAYVVYGDEMEADARKAFAGTGVTVIRAKSIPAWPK